MAEPLERRPIDGSAMFLSQGVSPGRRKRGAPGRSRWPLVLLLAALVADFYVTRRT
ncbi:hypothetical protein ACLESD_42005 [Pyxidicoccus sp. 3LFB2]